MLGPECLADLFALRYQPVDVVDKTHEPGAIATRFIVPVDHRVRPARPVVRSEAYGLAGDARIEMVEPFGE